MGVDRLVTGACLKLFGRRRVIERRLGDAVAEVVEPRFPRLLVRLSGGDAK